MGYPWQAWSAGMYVYAYHAVERAERRCSTTFAVLSAARVWRRVLVL